MTAEQLAAWLVQRGFGESRPGYGHATGDEIAEALLEAFEITARPADDGSQQ